MRRLLLSLLVMALATLAFAAPAFAAFGLEGFDVTFNDPGGAPVTQAGSHPYAMTTSFDVNTEVIEGKTLPVETIKDLITAQIPGFIGDQTAVPRCPTLSFLTLRPGSNRVPECADGSAVGLVKVEIGQKGNVMLTAPLYFLEPSPGTAAKLGFWVERVPVTVDIGISETPPYSLLAISSNITQALEFFGARLTLWGVPADPGHDKERGLCFDGKASCPAGVPERPFLTMPRACSGALETRYAIDSWPNPGIFTEGFSVTHENAVPPNPQGMTGCGKLSFGPTVSTEPSTSSAESSSGLDFSIDVSDEGLKNPAGIAQADIEELTVAFPAGMTANPSAAEGLGVCTKAQFEAEDLKTRGCPDAAKLGSIEAQLPLLEDHPLRGSIYLAQQDDPATPEPEAENPFDSLLALYMIIRDPELGIFVKLPIEVSPDPITGQLISTLKEIPPFPLGHVNVHLRSGPRAPFITPSSCGTYTTKVALTPSSGAPPLHTTSSFKINSGAGGGPCPSGGIAPFAPGFEAGSVNNASSAFSPFSMHLTRADGEQDLTRFSATLPPGVVPKLAGISKCPEAAIAVARAKSGRQEQANPSCPAASQIGHIIAGAGVGQALTYVPGSLYLGGPYHGAPLSAIAVVPAIAGPFDVGTIVTQVALNLNPVTYRGEVDGAASDPIPHILKGIPLKVRDIRVFADRPDFTLNPTNCKPTQTLATLMGSFADPFSPADDVPVSLASPYQAASCSSLAFGPKLTLSLKGGTRRNDHPALISTITYPYPSGPGYANIGEAVVVLPHSEFIDPNHINNPCTRVQFNANACPPTSVLGTATATSPLLDQPLEGPVYFRSNGGDRRVPDVAVDLHGEFHVILVGFVDSVHGRIRTTFRGTPDAPVSRFTLRLNGGKKKGLLVNSANLCAHQRHVKLTLRGQNGKLQESNPVLRTSCSAKSKRSSSARHRR